MGTEATTEDTPEWLRLEPGEEVVWTGDKRLRSIVGSVVGTAVFTLVALGGLVALFTRDFGVLPTEFDRPVYFLVGTGLVLAYFLITVVWSYYRVSNVDYALTTENVYVKKGVFSETVNRVRVGKIQNTTLSKDFFGNLFDYGSVGISTAGGSGTEMTLSELDDPGTFRQLLQRQMTAAQGRDRRDRSARSTDLDPETARELVAEARRMRETAAAVAELLGAEAGRPDGDTEGRS